MVALVIHMDNNVDKNGNTVKKEEEAKKEICMKCLSL